MQGPRLVVHQLVVEQWTTMMLRCGHVAYEYEYVAAVAVAGEKVLSCAIYVDMCRADHGPVERKSEPEPGSELVQVFVACVELVQLVLVVETKWSVVVLALRQSEALVQYVLLVWAWEGSQ